MVNERILLLKEELISIQNQIEDITSRIDKLDNVEKDEATTSRYEKLINEKNFLEENRDSLLADIKMLEENGEELFYEDEFDGYEDDGVYIIDQEQHKAKRYVFVMGLLGLILPFTFYLTIPGLVLSILAIVFSGKFSVIEGGEKVGKILGIIGVVFSVLMTIFNIVFFVFLSNVLKELMYVLAYY